MFPERVKQSIVDMLPRKAVPVLSLRNARAKSVVSIEHNTTTIHRTTTGSNYKMQWSNRNVPYSNVFKRYSVEYASDPRFQIQGAGQSSPWHLEFRILDPRRIQQNMFLNTFEYDLSASAARVLHLKIRKKDTIYRHFSVH